jgi:hypothetical protein
VGSNRIQQHQDRLRNWPSIAFHMQAAQQNKRVGNFLRDLIELASVNRMHRVKSAYLQFTVGAHSLSIGKQGIITERE